MGFGRGGRRNNQSREENVPPRWITSDSDEEDVEEPLKLEAGDYVDSEEEQEDLSAWQIQGFGSLKAAEAQRNAFSRFYRDRPEDKIVDKHQNAKNSVKKVLNRYNHSDGKNFATLSYFWVNNFHVEAPILPRKIIDSIATVTDHSGTRAYYRVVADKGESYVLMACHVNVHGFHRSDLRFVEADDRTAVLGSEAFSVIGNLYLGDIVVVMELARAVFQEKFEIPFGKLAPPHVRDVDVNSKCFWAVKRMAVLTRNIETDLLFVMLDNGVASAIGHLEGLVVRLEPGESLDSRTVYNGDAFVPAKIRCLFTHDHLPKYENALTAEASKMSSFPQALATIFDYCVASVETEMFEIGQEAYKKIHTSTTFEGEEEFELDPEEIVETCALTSYSAVMTVFKGRQDGRQHAMMDAKKLNGNLIEFSIRNPKKDPTEGRWTCSNRIRFRGKYQEGLENDTEHEWVQATIDTVVVNAECRQLRIVARVSRDSPKFDFSEGVHIVQQREPPKSALLTKGFFANLPKDSNGRRVIEARYGGEPIRLEENVPEIEEQAEEEEELNPERILKTFEILFPENKTILEEFRKQQKSLDDKEVEEHFSNLLKMLEQFLKQENAPVEFLGLFEKFQAQKDDIESFSSLLDMLQRFREQRGLRKHFPVFLERFEMAGLLSEQLQATETFKETRSFVQQFLESPEQFSKKEYLQKTQKFQKCLEASPEYLEQQRILAETCIEVPEVTESFLFPSNTPIFLNASQNQYVVIFLAGTPLIIVSSPFGCGKSMTIVTAALEVYKRAEGKRQTQLLITQSNYASVNLVDIARKVRDSDIEEARDVKKVKFLRYVSDENWKELPDTCRTEMDMPQLMVQVFADWARGALPNEDSLTDSEKRKMVLYLMDFMGNMKKYGLDLELSPEAFVGEAKRLYEAADKRRKEFTIDKILPKTLREVFFSLYKPDIIIATAESLRGLSRANLLRNVCSIQIDEASQLHDYNLLSLLSHFPNAHFGLIGDIHQLPPFTDPLITGKLHDYAIGDTMARALRENMFPKAELREVYRCHPGTTHLLSGMFYGGRLISGVTAEMRNEFMKRAPRHFWPNPAYPMILVDNKTAAFKMGTSFGNHTEVRLVQQIVDYILNGFPNGSSIAPEDIGVISFYSAQTSVLTEAMRGSGVKCGTVDSFQGTEREVIILCCTSERLSQFMELPNRLNVALSRARQATIIIGNVDRLKKAEYWSTVVEFAVNSRNLVNETRHPFCDASAGPQEEIVKLPNLVVEQKRRDNQRRAERRKRAAARKAVEAQGDGPEAAPEDAEVGRRRGNRGGRRHRRSHH